MEQMALQVVTKHPQGNFAWTDLMTTDVAAAKRFYGELFGWTYEDRPMGDGKSYTMASLHGQYVAGIMAIEEEMQMAPSWQSYIAVDNVDAAAAKVKTAGGTVLSPPMDVYRSGRMATLQDPSGAIISLWQANEHGGAGYAMGPGIASWHELWTKDANAALDFYKKLVGWAGTVNEGQNGQPYVSCNNGETPVAVILTLGPEMAGVPPHWAIYFGAADVKASAARAQQLGGNVIVQPTEAGGFPFALLQDPQGAMFFVMGTQA